MKISTKVLLKNTIKSFKIMKYIKKFIKAENSFIFITKL
ncbi:hypothetical protein ELI_3675 [Eubacterium callanderi]|uniref:Uncharacterized protein n=1 Tax=Eubacterium callanderi TaxID=53442 RepID=E3GPQ2_9FIRM|nr:hypothetical protein ELI_3675 [Eubacterium callanderi]